MPDLTDVKVGDTIWVAPRGTFSRHISPGSPQRVETVGRVWITTDRGKRYEKATGLVDAGKYAPTSKAWRSQQEYDEHDGLNVAWEKLAHRLCRIHGMPDGITLEKIQQVRELLGLDDDD